MSSTRSNPAIIIEAQNLVKSYGTRQVLKGINLSVQSSEIICLVGSSGAGKSTLLNILGTLDSPDQGEVYINGEPLSGLKGKQLALFRRRHIGFVFQFHNLLPEFSALENICLPAWLAGQSKQSAKNRAEELMQLLHIDHTAGQLPSQMSGGEQQRTAVARALINNPSVVLADEPGGNLDSKNAQELHSLFLRLRQELKQTFVIVTHNPEQASASDRIITLQDGHIKTN